MKRNKHYKIKYDNLLEKILNQFIFKLKYLGIKNICEYFRKPKIIKTINGVNFVDGFIDDYGVYHPLIDEEKIKIPSTESDEFKMAVWIKKNLGGRIDMVPTIDTLKGSSKIANTSTPDYIWNNEKWDLKSPNIGGKTIISRFTKLSKQKHQAKNLIFDVSKLKESNDYIFYLIEIELENPYRQWINKILVYRNSKIIKIYIR